MKVKRKYEDLKYQEIHIAWDDDRQGEGRLETGGAGLLFGVKVLPGERGICQRPPVVKAKTMSRTEFGRALESGFHAIDGKRVAELAVFYNANYKLKVSRKELLAYLEAHETNTDEMVARFEALVDAGVL